MNDDKLHLLSDDEGLFPSDKDFTMNVFEQEDNASVLSHRYRPKDSDSEDSTSRCSYAYMSVMSANSAKKTDGALTPGRAKDKIFQDLDLTILRNQPASSSASSPEPLNESFNPEVVPRNLNRPDESMLVHMDDRSQGKDNISDEVPRLEMSMQQRKHQRERSHPRRDVSPGLGSVSKYKPEPAGLFSNDRSKTPHSTADSDFDDDDFAPSTKKPEKASDFDDDRLNDLPPLPDEPISQCSQDTGPQLSQESSSRRKLTYSNIDSGRKRVRPNQLSPPQYPAWGLRMKNNNLLDGISPIKSSVNSSPRKSKSRTPKKRTEIISISRIRPKKRSPLEYPKWALKMKNRTLLDGISPLKSSPRKSISVSPKKRKKDTISVHDLTTGNLSRDTSSKNRVVEKNSRIRTPTRTPERSPGATGPKSRADASPRWFRPPAESPNSTSSLKARISSEKSNPPPRAKSKDPSPSLSRSPKSKYQIQNIKSRSEDSFRRSPSSSFELHSKSPPKRKEGAKKNVSKSKSKEDKRSVLNSPRRDKESTSPKSSVSSFRSRSNPSPRTSAKKSTARGESPKLNLDLHSTDQDSPRMSISRSRDRDVDNQKNQIKKPELAKNSRSRSRSLSKVSQRSRNRSREKEQGSPPKKADDANDSPFHSLLSESPKSRSSSLEIVKVKKKKTRSPEKSPERSASVGRESNSKPRSSLGGESNEIETEFGRGTLLEERFASRSIQFPWGKLEMPKGREHEIGEVTWEKKRFREDDIAKSTGKIYLFGDNDSDKNRAEGSERVHFGGMAAACGPFDRSKAFGIVTTFYDCKLPDVEEYREMLLIQFKELRELISQGLDLIIPSPNAADLSGKYSKSYFKNGKQIIKHNLGTGIAKLSQDYLELIQELLEELYDEVDIHDIPFKKRQMKVDPSGDSDVPKKLKKFIQKQKKESPRRRVESLSKSKSQSLPDVPEVDNPVDPGFDFEDNVPPAISPPVSPIQSPGSEGKPKESSSKRKRASGSPWSRNLSVSRDPSPIPRPKRKKRKRKKEPRQPDPEYLKRTVMRGNRRVRRKGMPKTTFGESVHWDSDKDQWVVERDDRPKPMLVTFGQGQHKLSRRFRVPFSTLDYVEHYIQLQEEDALTDDEIEEQREFIDGKLKEHKFCKFNSLKDIKEWYFAQEEEQIKRAKEKGGKSKKQGQKRKRRKKKAPKVSLVAVFDRPCSDDFQQQPWEMNDQTRVWNECGDGVQVSWNFQTREVHTGLLQISKETKYEDVNETELFVQTMSCHEGKVWIGFGGYPEKRMQENAGYVLPAGVRYCIHNKSKWKMAKFQITSMNPHEGFDEYPTVRGLQVLDPNAPESDSEDEPPPKRKKKKAPKSVDIFSQPTNFCVFF